MSLVIGQEVAVSADEPKCSAVFHGIACRAPANHVIHGPVADCRGRCGKYPTLRVLHHTFITEGTGAGQFVGRSES